MFTTGSKLLIGATVAAAVFAVVYGVLDGGALGTIGLISATVALALLAALDIFFVDSNVDATDPSAFESSAAAQATTLPSLWPFTVALGATTMTLGLVTTEAFFVVGLGLSIVGALEWMFQGWSERASGDPAYNESVRDQMGDPMTLPVTAAVIAAVVVYSFSRVMLGLPTKTSTVIAFSVVAAIVLAAGATIAVKRDLSKTAITGAMSIGVLALVGAGTVYGLNGEREIKEHHSTAYIAEEDECGTEETEADENASQTVAAKSNAAAEIVFDGNELTADVGGVNEGFDTLTLPRSNPNNIIFRNESDGAARLVIELHPDTDDDADEHPTERICTSLVEEEGAQWLTVIFDRPSIAVEEGYAFTVPGSDASLEVVVP